MALLARGRAGTAAAARVDARRAPFGATRCVRVACSANKQPDQQQKQQQPEQQQATASRRGLMLNGVNVGAAAVLASLLNIGAAPRPGTLGVRDYGAVKSLGLCPPSPNCISSAEDVNDGEHYVPAWTWNPQDGRGRRSPATKAQAMDELAEAVATLKPDGFEPTIVARTDDYLYAEYRSPTFGFVDDLEVFLRDDNSVAEYRSASRVGESDGNINRKRIKALRQALEKRGWASTGFR